MHGDLPAQVQSTSAPSRTLRGPAVGSKLRSQPYTHPAHLASSFGAAGGNRPAAAPGQRKAALRKRGMDEPEWLVTELRKVDSQEYLPRVALQTNPKKLSQTTIIDHPDISSGP